MFGICMEDVKSSKLADLSIAYFSNMSKNEKFN